MTLALVRERHYNAVMLKRGEFANREVCMRYLLLTAAVLLATSAAWSEEEVLYQPPVVSPAPVIVDEDPFAELLQNYPSQIIKTGPSCSIVKIQLPPGMSPEDIALP